MCSQEIDGGWLGLFAPMFSWCILILTIAIISFLQFREDIRLAASPPLAATGARCTRSLLFVNRTEATLRGYFLNFAQTQVSIVVHWHL